jgi:hypothetical protein
VTPAESSVALDTLLADAIAKFKARPGAKQGRFDAIKLAAMVIQETPKDVNDQALDLVKKILQARMAFKATSETAAQEIVKALENHVLDFTASMQELSNALGESGQGGGDGANVDPVPHGVWKP